jgi:cell division protein ZipA
MDGLRWLLLLFGLLVIAGVYLYSRRDRSAPEAEPVPGRLEPTLGGEQGVAVEAPAAEEPVVREEPAGNEDPVVESLQKIVTMRLVAKEGGSFAGDELILSMRGIGLRHGKFGIFHRYEGSDENNTIFSAASLVEPGSFDLSNIKEQQLPGISLFLILPGPIEGAEAFDLMMSAARALAQTLDGELLDESGSTLSIQRERYLREEIIQFEHSIKVA